MCPISPIHDVEGVLLSRFVLAQAEEVWTIDESSSDVFNYAGEKAWEGLIQSFDRTKRTVT